jgi:hypothetical protein
MISVSTRGQTDSVALAGFEPASFHAKRPLGKRASHSQPLGHETVHPQPQSQPHTLVCEVAGHGRRFRGSGFYVFPVSCLLLYRAVEVAGVEPANLCLQGSDPFRRRPRWSSSESRSAPLRNRTGSFRASAGRADHLRKRGVALAVGIEPTWLRWTDGSLHQKRRRANAWGDGRESNPYLAVHSRALSPLSYQHHERSALKDSNPHLSLIGRASLPLDERRSSRGSRI